MDKTIAHLRQLLNHAEIIAYPTETFYGLGVKYDQHDALERLYTIKQRPLDKAMPLIIGRIELITLLTPVIPRAAEKLIRQFWPGPLTLIFEARETLHAHITGRTGKVAVRMPGPSFALDLAKHLDFPITSTSANIAGMPPAETAEAVIGYFDCAFSAIVDCGKTPGNAPSTIVDVSGAEVMIVRKGVITQEEVFAAVVHQ